MSTLITTTAQIGTIKDAGGNNTAMTIASDGTVAFAKKVYFYGQKASSQTLSRGVDTNVTGFTNGELDSHSGFDGTTFTVPSGQGGIYHIACSVEINYGDVGQDGEAHSLRIKKNGSTIRQSRYSNPNNQGYTNFHQMEAAGIFSLSASDAITINVTGGDVNGGGGGKILGGSSYYDTSVFYGFKLD